MSELLVHLDLAGRPVAIGTLRFHPPAEDRTTFSYLPDWLAHPMAFALSPELRLGLDPFHVAAADGSLPGIMRDGAPDRWGRKLLALAAKLVGSPAPLTEKAILLCIDDNVRVGALRYSRPGEASPTAAIDTGKQITVGRIEAIIAAAENASKGFANADDLKILLGDGSPLGGARPKSAVLDSGLIPSIAKLAKPGDTRSIAAGEVLASALAAQAGIRAAETRLLKVANGYVSIVKRFDRTAQGERHHYASALTLLEAKEGEAATYTDIALAIRRFGRDPKADLPELFRRAAFNVLVSNFDDHLRNHGFLHAGAGQWRLSPAFDMNPAPAHESRRELATWISEEGPQASLENLLAVSREFGLSAKNARETVAEVAAVTSRWKDAGRRLGLSDSDISDYSTAFEHDESRSAVKLTATRHSAT
jgi:serine/threonine-protein kinase HipA